MKIANLFNKNTANMLEGAGEAKSSVFQVGVKLEPKLVGIVVQFADVDGRDSQHGGGLVEIAPRNAARRQRGLGSYGVENIFLREDTRGRR